MTASQMPDGAGPRADAARIDLVVTADDFGADEAVNEAVERAHRDGVLTAASLMVTGHAVDDAVARARRLPSLGVGLHLVLVDGQSALPPAPGRALADAQGRFYDNMALTGLRLAISPAARRELAAEIEAQFAAFARTGLPLDHVNAHKHFHVHPVIARMVVDAARRHGARAIRAPVEPGSPRGSARLAVAFARWLRARARRAGLAVPDRVFGLAESGRMDAGAMARAVAGLEGGLNEIYLHPATRDEWPGHAPGYRYRDEMEALLDPAVIAGVAKAGADLGPFARFAAAGAGLAGVGA
ncbi:hopanoid biosynthesis-associated protein HpnK [Novosphingobium pituita]|uniref:Hopanoid biosynthesis-associated protein HpnK n=1 Tax=Novosphingobium pituita TaxID=3056842 RepID=A0ABQ6P6D7_9SPHN|nr:hopanoid biosynthesis-associated protein HpnK [Novosphingobium sp. IK01]GMM60818.1 hopanoid biosynthesis-associated protein HpnK [Novosphingobium sp. IK01]